jgi:hypothetical protein
LAKRRRFSRWRRLPGVYRFGDDKPADPNLEPQRLTLYVSGLALDRAEIQAQRLGFADVQDYCTTILLNAIEAEHVRAQMAEFEARRGPLEGFHEIADDPEFLAEMRSAVIPRDSAEPHVAMPAVEDAEAQPLSIRFDGPVRIPDEPFEVDNAPVPARPETPAVRSVEDASPTISRAAQVVLRHAGQSGDDSDPYAFLPCLRRGEPVPPSEVAELAQALVDLEKEYRESRAMDRRLTFALHRLAFESQILHTDAWPGSFDLWTVDMLRAVQEAVERILSGQDIRYYPALDDDNDNAPRPENSP